jgi:hypothetical protein
MLLLLLLLLLSCVGFQERSFFVNCGVLKKGVTKTTTTQFFVFLFCLETFLISPHKKLSHHQKKKKMADTSMDYSEYSENENSPMPVAKVRESIRIER